MSMMASLSTVNIHITILMKVFCGIKSCKLFLDNKWETHSTVATLGLKRINKQRYSY